MANTNAVAPPAQPQMTVQQANNAAQRLLVQNSVEMIQNIYSSTIYPNSQPTINLIPRNVGIIKKFIIRLVGQVQNTGAAQASMTRTGLANLLSNVTFYDLQNNLRINTTGSHLQLLSSMKRRRPYLRDNGGMGDIPIYLTNGGAAIQSLSQAWNIPFAHRYVLAGPQGLNAGTTDTVAMFFEVPLAYSDDDLRGAVFANVVNTTMSLQLTFNAANAFTGTSATADDNYSVYVGQGLLNQVKVDVYQVYLDQLPTAKDGSFILPQISLATVYELKTTTFRSIPTNQDFPVPFTNFRDFFSVFALYNSTGDNSGYYEGNINYWSLTTANFTNVFKYTPDYANYLGREVLGADIPVGYYYFSFRRHPIWTTQFGNQQINLNANVANASAYLQVFWEDMALQNTLVGSASLPAGG